MTILTTFAALMCIIGIIVGVTFLLYKIIDWFDYYTNAKRKRTHPELYKWFNEAHEKGEECIQWYNNEIAPYKRQVDIILRDWNYYTKKEKEQKEREIEELNNHIYVANITDKILEEEREAICDKIKKYIVDNNLKWAKKWGW